MTPDLLSLLLASAELPTLTARDWEDLLGQARRARLLARLAQRFKDRGWIETTPRGPAQYLEAALRAADRHHNEALWEIDRIRHALAGVPTPIVLLKGAAYLQAGLPPARGRLFADIDIMVTRDQLAAVEAALFAAGWIPEKQDAYDKRYYREWMHELPPLQHVLRGTVIDVHHTITPPTSRFNVDASSLLERSTPLCDDSRLRVLAPADMVLHSAVHLFQEGEFDHGLRDLLDLNDLLLHFGRQSSFWPDLLRRARALGLEVPLSHALIHLRRLFGTVPPDALAEEVASMNPHRLTRAVMSSLLSTALRPDHPSCDGSFTPVARWLLYVRAHYLRMPLHRVIPHLVRKAYMRRFPAKV